MGYALNVMKLAVSVAELWRRLGDEVDQAAW
jgi:hypothetical protein